MYGVEVRIQCDLPRVLEPTLGRQNGTLMRPAMILQR